MKMTTKATAASSTGQKARFTSARVQDQAAFTSPGAPAFSMVAESTTTPFCCASRASHAIRASNGAFSRRTDRLPALPGSLPASAPASPDSRAERSTITSSDSPVAAGGGAEPASSGTTPCIQARSARLVCDALPGVRHAAVERHQDAEDDDEESQYAAADDEPPLALGECGVGFEGESLREIECHAQVPLACTWMRPS